MPTVVDLLVAQARNNSWSNHRLHAACARLGDDEYLAPRASFFGSIHATLDHILLVDLLYLGRMQGEERVPRGAESICDGRADLRERQAETDRELLSFCEALDERALASVRRWVAYDGKAFEETIAATLQHLFQHQVHHRGQVHDMLSATSVAPPQLDEFFLRGDLPLRREELAELGLPEE